MALFASVLPVSAQAVMQHYQLNIPRQSLDTALKDFAHQTGLQVARFSDAPRGTALVVGPVSGDMSVGEALTALLKTTGLTYRVVNDRTIAVVIPGAGSAASPQSTSRDASQLSTYSSDAGNEEEAKKSFWNRFLVAQVDQGTSSGSTPVEKQSQQTSKEKPVQLEEVVVTAQKREERLQDVPVPVTAISAAVLNEQNLVRVRDYFTRVPGLGMATTDYTGGDAKISIRGLSTGGIGYGTNPTVGIVVDDVPYGASTSIGGGSLMPDLDPSELSRIEVLRGPQGTLYGANSIGGLLKFVTVDPSTSSLSGRVQAGVDGVQHGDAEGYNLRGAVNVPLSDTFAVRASGFTRRDPGYIDNVLTGKKSVNSADVNGGRLSTLWRPSEGTSLKLSALIQDTKRNGEDDVDRLPGLGELQQRVWPGTGKHKAESQAYSANLTSKLGDYDLTILSGYNINSFDTNYDLTPTFFCVGFAQSIFGVDGCPWTADSKARKFSQEVRLSRPLGRRLDWLLGAFYTDEKVNTHEITWAADAAGVVSGQIYDLNFSNTYREYAAFSGLTYHFTDQFNVQLGGRAIDLRQSFAALWSGPFLSAIGAPNPSNFPKNVTKDHAFTYLVTPQYKASEDLMIYARLASGYRAGGPNFLPALGTPLSYKPDSTQNYEIGVKGAAFDRALSFDASLYHIDWKDLQVYMLNKATGSAFFANTGSAKSEGLELSVEVVPRRGTTATAWIAWNNAVLTQDFPSTSVATGHTGDRLPFSSRFSGSASLDQKFPLGGNMTGFIGGSVSYVGERFDVFAAGPQRQRLPGYAQTDLRVGVEYGPWRANLYVNNVADRLGVISGGIGNQIPYDFRYIQPRTVGMTVSRVF
jgi:outer membrane receptor protein involved in Fe transport